MCPCSHQHFQRALALATVMFCTDVAAHDPNYESLETYCLSLHIDTAQNCRCGQLTADRIMSTREQALLLAMLQNREFGVSMARKRPALLDKLRRVTKGCAG